jgi:hypothetical protein
MAAGLGRSEAGRTAGRETIRTEEIDVSTDLWCILRSGGSKTLPLVRALNNSGIGAWTPTMTMRRRRPRSNDTLEIAAPIVPTFAFAPSEDIEQLLIIRSSRFSTHPPFSIMGSGDRIALVREGQLHQLREEEESAASRYAILLQVEADQLDRKERAALLRTEKARRKALRAQYRDDIAIGSSVTVEGVSPFTGMAGAVLSGDGKVFRVAFGGSLDIKIEAWQLVPEIVSGFS